MSAGFKETSDYKSLQIKLVAHATGCPKDSKEKYHGNIKPKTTGGKHEVIDETFTDSASFKESEEGSIKD